MDQLTKHARQIAMCIVDSEWTLRSLHEQLEIILAGGPPDPRRLAARLCLLGGTERSPGFDRIVAIFSNDEACREHLSTQLSLRLRPAQTVIQPVPEHLSTLPLPRLANRRDLARWLGLSDRDLEWFAGIDRRYDSRIEQRVNHYHYEWRQRSNGPPRLLEKPKPHLKALQRQILQQILNRIPPHDQAHGFRRHRSCRSCVESHTGVDVLLRMDLQDFFLSITRARVEGIFRLIGYPERVAATLAGLCTHRTRLQNCRNPNESIPHTTGQRLIEWHLPQGAPTSPALANLSAWRLDARLNGLADKRQLTYTRYADDLALSGDLDLYRQRAFIEPLIGSIALEEGFFINHRKTRWMRSFQRQHFCGITLNQHPNPSRKQFDRLKAILHNCIRFSPYTQNHQGHPDFRRHLEGQVSHFIHLNPQRGEKLRKMLNLIDW